MKKVTTQHNKKDSDIVLDIADRPTLGLGLALSLQHLFAMFGATVLVPILVGLDPGIALFSSGVGTLLHILITKRKIPAYMGSSFAFIVPMQSLMKTVGYPGIAQGIFAVGVVYLVVALIISKIGTAWLDRALPPIVVGPIIMTIGLSLAGSAADNATLDAAGNYDWKILVVALLTLLITILFNMFLSGFWGQIAILLGIVCGYLIALLFGLVDFQPVIDAPWFRLPKFEIPFVSYPMEFHWSAMLMMAPIAFVTMTEHMGHIMVLNDLTKRNFFKDPGLHKTLTGDGVASLFAGLVGGPAITSYGENIGVMAINRIYSVYVIIGAASLAIVFSFVGKLSALIQSIPGAVLGGVSFLLFGVIATAGLRILIENKIDFNARRNLMIASSILVIGIGNVTLQLDTFQFSGVALATVLGILLNLFLPKKAVSEQ
ncbi:uracil-xanthine permease family protein [Enterococcus timonensis]|uniref:uracil-xanthine permease family protein n=1 Tax=Enterococcus timonensis TaxID=1852364 RepID=UPI0008D91397|nr:solute carrier family 23 protein [Enterococcus timonensis]